MENRYVRPDSELMVVLPAQPLALSAGIGGMVEEGELNEYIF